jgi:histidine triad (HIT) family protein
MPSIFTRIIKGEIPSHRIAENDAHIAFLDIRPVAKGHTLIVPKQEIDKWTDLPSDVLSDTILFTKTVAQHLEHTLKPMRVGLVIEGMEVPHAHIHLIPIYQAGQSMSLSLGTAASQDELAEVVAQCSMLQS